MKNGTIIKKGFINTTETVLNYIAYVTISARYRDVNANFTDNFWRGYFTVKVDGVEEKHLVGVGGSNNKQYDHHTWDTVTRTFTFSLGIGEVLDYSTSIEKWTYDEDNQTYKQEEVDDMTIDETEPTDVITMIVSVDEG